MWAQLIECPELPLHHTIPTDDATSTTNTPCVGFQGQPTPLYLAPPDYSGDDSSSGGPIPSRALSAPFALLDVDFADVITQELGGGTEVGAAQHANGPVRVGERVAVPVVAGGTAHGVLMWWELAVRAWWMV